MTRTVTVTRVDAARADGRVRHFDELDDESQRLVADAAGGRTRCVDVPGLDHGDVVVFTEYYEVVGC